MVQQEKATYVGHRMTSEKRLYDEKVRICYYKAVSASDSHSGIIQGSGHEYKSR
jgi:lipid A disaccharide synthetase